MQHTNSRETQHVVVRPSVDRPSDMFQPSALLPTEKVAPRNMLGLLVRAQQDKPRLVKTTLCEEMILVLETKPSEATVYARRLIQV